MNLRKPFVAAAAIALAWSGTAFGALELLEDAFELDLTQLRLPSFSTDQMTIKECDDCETRTVRVDNKTTYHLGGQSMDLNEFLRATSLLGEKQENMVTVFYLPESLVVTRIVVTTTG